MYLLDTNICIFLIKKKNFQLIQKITSCNKDEIFISSITLAELEYGAFKSQYREKNRQAILNFFGNFNHIIDFNSQDAEVFGAIRAYLEKKGNIIGPYDMQIAAQGLARDLTVITNNVNEFSRIPGLKVEDWSL